MLVQPTQDRRIAALGERGSVAGEHAQGIANHPIGAAAEDHGTAEPGTVQRTASGITRARRASGPVVDAIRYARGTVAPLIDVSLEQRRSVCMPLPRPLPLRGRGCGAFL